MYLFVCLAQIISFQSLLHFVPVCICYGSFASMVYWTLKLFHNMRVLKQLELWRGLLRVFVSDNTPTSPLDKKSSVGNSFYTNSPEADLEEVKPTGNHVGLDTFRWASAEPYANFFTSVFVFVLAFALTKSVPNGIFLCATSILFCFLTLFALTDRWDMVVWWTLLLDFISSLPLVMERFQIEKPALFQEFVLEPMGDIKVTLGFSSFAFGMIPLTYGGMIARNLLMDSSYGNVVRLYRGVATHLVILFWWQIGLMLLTSGGMVFSVKSVLLTGAVLSLMIFPTMLAVGIVVGLAISQLRDSLNISNVLKVGKRIVNRKNYIHVLFLGSFHGFYSFSPIFLQEAKGNVGKKIRPQVRLEITAEGCGHRSVLCVLGDHVGLTVVSRDFHH